MSVATRVFALLFLLLNLFSIAYAETGIEPLAPLALVSAASAKSVQPAADELEKESKSKSDRKSKSELFRYPSEADRCDIECTACSSGGFPLTCDRIV
jgi:hypothetical protein